MIFRSLFPPVTLTQFAALHFILFHFTRVTLFLVKWGTGVSRQWVLICIWSIVFIARVGISWKWIVLDRFMVWDLITSIGKSSGLPSSLEVESQLKNALSRRDKKQWKRFTLPLPFSWSSHWSLRWLAWGDHNSIFRSCSGSAWTSRQRQFPWVCC